MPGTEAEDDMQPSGKSYDPPYCYKEQSKMKFSVGNNTGLCSHIDTCLCMSPTTEAPTTEAPTTEAPTTQAPTTEAPTTEGCFLHGTRVQIITGSDYSGESCACSTLVDSICPGGGWKYITWEDQNTYKYQYEDLERCVEASVHMAVTSKSTS